LERNDGKGREIKPKKHIKSEERRNGDRVKIK
jgi:hypothetical protein